MGEAFGALVVEHIRKTVFYGLTVYRLKGKTMKGMYYVVVDYSTDYANGNAPDVYAFADSSKMCQFRKMMKLVDHVTRQVSPSFVNRALDTFGGAFGKTWATEQFNALRYYPAHL